MDDLSSSLNYGIGGHATTEHLPHISTEHSLLYNGNKSFSMCFKPSTIKSTRPWFFLADMTIPIVTHCKYLGVIVSEHNSDNDLKRQLRKFYGNANMLIRKFSKCSVNIKCYLLRLTVQQRIVQLYGLISLRQH